MSYKSKLTKGVLALETAYDELKSASSEYIPDLLGHGDIVVAAVAYALDVAEDDLINAAIDKAKNREVKNGL